MGRQCRTREKGGKFVQFFFRKTRRKAIVLGLRPRCGDNIKVPVLEGNTAVPVCVCVCFCVDNSFVSK
jgi:hypothetical protein